MSEYLPIASFDEQQPAEALARRLSEEGFEGISSNDAADQLLRFCNLHPRAHCHVQVPGPRLEAALQRLKELDQSEPALLASAIRCPECGSFQVEFPQFSRKTVVGAIGPALAAAAGLVDREFYCTACQFSWPPTSDPAETVPIGKDLLDRR